MWTTAAMRKIIAYIAILRVKSANIFNIKNSQPFDRHLYIDFCFVIFVDKLDPAVRASIHSYLCYLYVLKSEKVKLWFLLIQFQQLE